MAEREKPVPLADEHSAAYWDAARDGRLLVQRCGRCGTHQFYPRRHCAACLAPEPDWVEATGRGRLHTFSVVRRSANPEFAGDCPYVFAIVELEEGVRLATRIVGAEEGSLRCDMPVRLTAGGGPLPVFEVDDR
jgi:uncharacterized protein